MMKLISYLSLAAGIAAVGAAGAGAAQAAGQQADTAPVVRADPYLPPAKRVPSGEAAASGEALRAQALQKLRQRFDQADLDANGSLTLDEARRAGLGYVAQHFADIDSAHSGKVSFEDLRQYMAQRRKEALQR